MPKILNFVKIIHYYSKLFTGVRMAAARPETAPRASGSRFHGASSGAASLVAGSAAGASAYASNFFKPLTNVWQTLIGRISDVSKPILQVNTKFEKVPNSEY